jgi:transposase
MFYCGLDVASVSSFFCVKNALGARQARGEFATTREGLTGALKRFVKAGLKVALEAGNQTAWLHETLVELGAEVVVVNAAKVRLIAESRRKTDKVDAEVLCDLLRLDGLPTPVHMPSQASRELRGLLVARRQVVQARAKLCNVARGMLRQEGVRLPARALHTFKGWAAVRANSYKSTHLPLVLEAYARSFKELTRSIQALDKELKVRAQGDARVALLRTMPLVGLIGALTLVAAVDDVERFSSGRKLVRYSGLTPTVRQSGERTAYGPICREGRRELRAVWVQIAHLVANDRSLASGRLRAWFWRVAKRRGKKTAVVALARKLLAIAYQMLKTGETFDAKRIGRAA